MASLEDAHFDVRCSSVLCFGNSPTCNETRRPDIEYFCPTDCTRKLL